MVFITPENQREEWLNFECGAMLTRVGEQQLCPVLIDLPNLEYKGPLKNLQLTAFEDKEEMRKLVLDIHDLSESTVTKEVISDTFDDRWDRFVAAATEGMARHIAGPLVAEAERGNDDKLDEALDMLRALTRESRRSAQSQGGGGPTNARAAWAFVRRFKHDEIPFESFVDAAQRLDRDLRGEIVTLEGGGAGRIMGVEARGDEVFAIVETGHGKGSFVSLVELLPGTLQNIHPRGNQADTDSPSQTEI